MHGVLDVQGQRRYDVSSTAPKLDLAPGTKYRVEVRRLWLDRWVPVLPTDLVDKAPSTITVVPVYIINTLRLTFHVGGGNTMDYIVPAGFKVHTSVNVWVRHDHEPGEAGAHYYFYRDANVVSRGEFALVTALADNTISYLTQSSTAYNQMAAEDIMRLYPGESILYVDSPACDAEGDTLDIGAWFVFKEALDITVSLLDPSGNVLYLLQGGEKVDIMNAGQLSTFSVQVEGNYTMPFGVYQVVLTPIIDD